MSDVEPEKPQDDSWQRWHSSDHPLLIGVSTCLLGENVRFDGGHARKTFVADRLAQWFEFVSVCPEVEVGMGIPRPTIRLVDEGDGVRLIAPSTGEDHTDRMTAFATARVAQLKERDLDGYILKKGSPSCGLERIKVYRKGMPLDRNESGLFAAALRQDWPALPVEEEGRLNDPELRENFIERVFCRNRWRALVARGLTRQRLVAFHTAHKLLLRAHHEVAYQSLGQLVAGTGEMSDEERFARYETDFQQALCTKATHKSHTNVLYHAMGYLKKVLAPIEKVELIRAIEDYRKGLLPLIVPLTLVRYNIRSHRVGYLEDQLYFSPHPKELMLRNHA